MPLVKPVRDLKTVRCVRRYKDKNGETKYNLRVLFNYAESPWNLTREEVSSAKELFKIYDTDNDGVITYLQLKSAMKVLGHRYSDEALLLEVRQFSNCKNSSMEFNEFLKMIATIKQKTITQSDLLEAFRAFDKEGTGLITNKQMKIILFKMGKSPLTQENIQDLVKASSRDGDRVDYEALVREMMASVD